jgi:hypothetical protein
MATRIVVRGAVRTLAEKRHIPRRTTRLESRWLKRPLREALMRKRIAALVRKRSRCRSKRYPAKRTRARLGALPRTYKRPCRRTIRKRTVDRAARALAFFFPDVGDEPLVAAAARW